MSTIGSLLALMEPGIKPYAEQELTENRIQGGQITNQTALLQLADIKRQQEAEAQVMAAIQSNPALAQQLFGGGSVLGSLGPSTGGPPAPTGGAPMTQQTVMPGQPPGAPQVVPGGQDLSRFATPGGPPQSTLASLGPQPQAPQNPLLEMARRDPRAALLLQQRMQEQEALGLKRQQQRLEMGTKVMEYLGRGAQGVTDQASLDAFRQDVARVHPQAAAQLPQVYSKEAMAPFIAKALDVKEAMTLQVQDLQAQAALIKARKEGRSVEVDNQLRAMGVQPGQETPAQIKDALQAVEDAKVRVSASHGTGQIVQTPTGMMRVNPRTNAVEPIEAPGGGPLYPKPTAEEQRAASYADRAKAAHETAVSLEEKGLTPGIWSTVGEALPFGLGNYLVGEDQQRYRQTVNQFAQAILRKESGAAISPTEYTMTERTYFPQPGDSKTLIAQKRQERERVIQSMQEEGKQTGRPSTQGQPTSPGARGGASRGATSQGPAGEKVVTRAALHAEADRRGVSHAQAEQQARAKGYEVR